jgi:hypothetical protein
MLLDPIVGRSDGLIIGLRNFISASQRQLRDQTLQTRPRLGPLFGTKLHVEPKTNEGGFWSETGRWRASRRAPGD